MLMVAFILPMAYGDDVTVFMLGDECTECYTPQHLTVDAGTMVVWENVDGAVHTVTSGNIVQPTNQFNSGLVQPDKFYAIKFVDVGIYPYFCMLHPWMNGMVTVGEKTAQVAELNTEEMMFTNSTIILSPEMIAAGMYTNSTGHVFYANGTAVIPEFPIAMIVLAVGIGAIVVTVRFRSRLELWQ